MKKSYNDIKALKADLKKDINAVLADEVFNEVRKCELEHIEEDVYSVYNPKIYKRRAVGGVSDPDSIVGSVKDMELTVANTAEFNDNYGSSNHGRGLAELINQGEMRGSFYYDYPGEFTLPRPFIDRTVEELENSNRLDNALIKGLRKKGIDAN